MLIRPVLRVGDSGSSNQMFNAMIKEFASLTNLNIAPKNRRFRDLNVSFSVEKCIGFVLKAVPGWTPDLVEDSDERNISVTFIRRRNEEALKSEE
ncbi:hypothetical protein Tco_0396901 [Tanacetum coccineum]